MMYFFCFNFKTILTTLLLGQRSFAFCLLGDSTKKHGLLNLDGDS